MHKSENQKTENGKEKDTILKELKNPKYHEFKRISKKITTYSFWIIIMCFALYGVIFIAKYVGYVTFHEAKAGYITELELTYYEPAYNWAGFAGVISIPLIRTNNPVYEKIVQPAGVYDSTTNPTGDMMFSCLQKDIEHEIYSSPYPYSDLVIDDSVTGATPADLAIIDAYMGLNTSQLFSASNTFTNTTTIRLGERPINAVAAYTKQQSPGNGTSFVTAVLKDINGKYFFAAKMVDTGGVGFNRMWEPSINNFTIKLYNYQLLLPLNNATGQSYYFFMDPFDQCPEGSEDSGPTGFVAGNITDQLGNRIELVIVSAGGTNGYTDINGQYNVRSAVGSQLLIAIKDGYVPYTAYVNVTQGNTTYHNIILERTNTQIGPGQTDFTGIGPGVGPGQSNGVGPGQNNNPNQDVGPGIGPGVGPYVEQPKLTEGKDFVISIPQIKRVVREGGFLEETIDLYNFKKEAVTVTFSLEGNISDVVELKFDKLTINPKSTGELKLTIFGQPPEGMYNGSIIIGGSLNEKIPVKIEVTNKNLLPINALFLELDALDREVHPGDTLRHRTVLRNLITDAQYPVYLFYSIRSVNDNTTLRVSPEYINIRTTFAILKKEKLPKDLPPGEYEITVQATYLDYTSSVNTIFKVTLPFYLYKIFGVLPVWLLFAILTTLLVLAALGYYYYRKQQSKKRYHLKVDYNEMPKPSPRNVFVGKISETNNKVYFNLENFKTHTIVAGSTGGGKSFSAQVIIEEMLLHDVAIIVFDPTAQWTGFLRKMDNKSLFALYPMFDMKPSDARAFNGNIREISDAREKIDIKKYMKRGEIQIFACHKLDPKDMDTYVANAIREVFHARFDESRDLRLMLIFDEVHRLLPKFGGSGEGFLQIERGCREFRKWGIGIMMISQVLSDFVGQIKANINTEIQMRTRDEGDLDRIAAKYGKEVLQSLVKASVGSGMIENPAYNRGQPFFVSFKPVRHSVERLSDDEISKYNRYNDIMDQLSYELDQLEGENGQDVFDLRLELKLSLDKVKGGNFNMVDIYLEGLKPRIEKLWEKLGKKPKKMVRELISSESLKDELEKAKQSREEFEKEQAKKDAEDKKTTVATDVKKKTTMTTSLQYSDSFNFANGTQVISLQELIDVLPTMDAGVVAKSVNAEKNDIEKWVRNKIGSDKLADKLVGKLKKDEIMAVLTEEQKNPSVIEPKTQASPTAQVQAQPASAPQQNTQQPPPKTLPNLPPNNPPQIQPQQAPPIQAPPQQTPQTIPPQNPPQNTQTKMGWMELKNYISGKTDEEKISILQKASDDSPNDINIKVALANTHFKKTDYQKAKETYSSALSIKPDSKEIMYLIAKCESELGKKDEAIQTLNKLLGIDSTFQKAKDLLEAIKPKAQT